MSEKFEMGNWLTVVVDLTGKVAFQNAWEWGEAKKKARALLGKEAGE